MKTLCVKSLGLLTILLSMTFGCESSIRTWEEDSVWETNPQTIVTPPDISANDTRASISETKIDQPLAENLENAPVEPALLDVPPEDYAAQILPEVPAIITPITAPWEFAKSPFDDSVIVDPVLANYVGSYGILPSRTGNPTFIYSHSVPADVALDDDEEALARLYSRYW